VLDIDETEVVGAAPPLIDSGGGVVANAVGVISGDGAAAIADDSAGTPSSEVVVGGSGITSTVDVNTLSYVL
jgi:hypothetical protein